MRRAIFTGADEPKREPLGLMACKVILWSNLPSSAKAVGGVLLDHVNWRRGENFRCDPSVDRITELSGRSRSTVQAALQHLVVAGVLIVHIHGGKSLRNAYEFRWDIIRERDAETREALKSGRRPPWLSGLAGPEARAQTRVRNPMNEPVGHAEAGTARKSYNTVRRLDAARQKAAERWEEDLRERSLEQYIALLPLIDEELQEAATDAEMSKRGAGVDVVLNELCRRALDHVRKGA